MIYIFGVQCLSQGIHVFGPEAFKSDTDIFYQTKQIRSMVSCLRQGSLISNVCLKQGQVLRASSTHLYL